MDGPGTPVSEGRVGPGVPPQYGEQPLCAGPNPKKGIPKSSSSQGFGEDRVNF